jgi:gamma-D-glutamyl-L-lysine dipeptidyl-peptidase
MNYGICALSMIPMRIEPSDRSEMVNMLLFGEQFYTIEKSGKWLKIHLLHDGYEGWISEGAYMPLDEKQVENRSSAVLKSLGKCRREDDPDSQVILLPGSTLPDYDAKDRHFVLGNHDHQLTEGIIAGNNHDFVTELINTAHSFLNAPYLWGGRSLFGIDCSGFTQVVYKIAGISLPRDAAQQATQGVKIDSISNALPGDLAFFGEGQGRISHVGMVMEHSRIIHASGKVRIDLLDTRGILNENPGIYSHNLIQIRRIYL